MDSSQYQTQHYDLDPSIFDNDIDQVGAELDRIPEDQLPYHSNPFLGDISGIGYRSDISSSSESSVSYDSQSDFSSLYNSESPPDNLAASFSSMQLDAHFQFLGHSPNKEAHPFENPHDQHNFLQIPQPEYESLEQYLDISSFENEINQAQPELDGNDHSMARFISEPTPSSIVGTGHSSGTLSEPSLSHDSQSSYTSSYASDYPPNDSLASQSVVPMETISSHALVSAPPPSQCVQAGRKHICMHCPRRFKTRWNLKTHIETHLPVGERKKQYGCTNANCGYASARKNDLKRHKMSCRHKA